MKILSITFLTILLLATAAFSLPSYTNISNINNEVLNTINNESNNIANDILNNDIANKEKESILMVAGTGGSTNPSISNGIYDPTQNHPTYTSSNPTEYTGEYVIPEPMTIILLGLGLTGLALRRKF